MKNTRFSFKFVCKYAEALGQNVMRFQRLGDRDYALVLWGVGNHGGGPSRKDLSDIERMMSEEDYKIIHSYPEAYFEKVNPTFEVKERAERLGHNPQTGDTMVIAASKAPSFKAASESLVNGRIIAVSANPIFFDDIIHILIPTAGEIDEHGALAHGLC